MNTALSFSPRHLHGAALSLGLALLAIAGVPGPAHAQKLHDMPPTCGAGEVATRTGSGLLRDGTATWICAPQAQDAQTAPQSPISKKPCEASQRTEAATALGHVYWLCEDAAPQKERP